LTEARDRIHCCYTNTHEEFRIPGFYQMSLDERRAKLADRIESPQDLSPLRSEGGLSIGAADHMIENVVGLYALPLGIALNFLINGKDVLVPMVIEEPSVWQVPRSWPSWRAQAGGSLP